MNTTKSSNVLDDLSETEYTKGQYTVIKFILINLLFAVGKIP